MKLFLIAALGSCFQEFLYHVDLYRTLPPAGYKKLVRSITYYVLGVGTIVLSGAVIAVAYSDQPGHLSNFEIMIFGAAAPALFKNAVSAMTKRTAHAGIGPETVGDQVRDYFKVS